MVRNFVAFCHAFGFLFVFGVKGVEFRENPGRQFSACSRLCQGRAGAKGRGLNICGQNGHGAGRVVVVVYQNTGTPT